MELELAKKESEQLELDKGKDSPFSQASRKKKFIATFSIYYCQFAAGMGFNFLGPSLVDFSNKFDTDVENVAVVFSVLTGAYLAGACLGGVVSNLVNRQTVVLSSIAIGSAALFLLPHISTIGLYFVLASMIGIFNGGHDIVQIAWIIDIWRHESPPYILAQHFSYSIGTIVPPLLLSPFLNGEKKNKTTTTAAVSTATEITSILAGISSSTGTEQPESDNKSADLWVPFTIAGCILGFGLVVLTGVFIMFYSELKQFKDQNVSKIGTKLESSKVEKSKFKFPKKEKIILVSLSCCCIATYQGLELNTMNFLPTYAQFCTAELSEAQGADLLFGLTGAYALLRGIGILLVLKVPPHYLILGNFILLLVANVLFLFAGASEESTLLWVASVVMGFGMSTTYPAYYAYIEKYLFISDNIVTVIVISAGAVSAIYPIIVGKAVEHTPNVMIYVNLFSLTLFAVAFSLTFWLTFMKSRKAKG